MLQIALIIVIALALMVLITEIRGRSIIGSITARQRTLRAASAFLLIIILLMVLIGDKWLIPVGPMARMTYWLVCLSLAVGLIGLALLDMREAALGYVDEKKKIIRSIPKKDEDKKSE